jgi:putative transposase
METKFAEIPDALWEQVEPLLPGSPPGRRRWRPPIPARRILSGIVYRLRTGSQWKALPEQFGSGSACHARFQSWCAVGIFRRLFERIVEYYDDVCGAQWEWASLDSAMVKAPKGGDATGPNPTDRGKSGVKRHIVTDEIGVPLAAEITAANVHDKRAAVSTVDAIVMRAPRGRRRPKNLCLDKGYDFDDVEREIRSRGIRPHIRRRGEDRRECRRGRARRWVVERTNAWHNRFRGLLIRWERKATNYLGLLHLACAMIALRHTM